MWISLPTFSQHVIEIAASLRRYASKLNQPKTSDNLDIGTKKNVVSDFIGRNINRMDEHQKLGVQVGRGVTAKKRNQRMFD
jgi:hypothetical protein